MRDDSVYLHHIKESLDLLGAADEVVKVVSNTDVAAGERIGAARGEISAVAGILLAGRIAPRVGAVYQNSDWRSGLQEEGAVVSSFLSATPLDIQIYSCHGESARVH